MFARKGKPRSASTTRLGLAAPLEDDEGVQPQLPPGPGSRRSSSSTAASGLLNKPRRASTARIPAPAEPDTRKALPAPPAPPPPAAPPPRPPGAAAPTLPPAPGPAHDAAPLPPPPPSPPPPSSWRVLGRRHTMPRLFLDTRLSPIVSSVSPKTSPLLSPEVATPRPLPETPRTPAVRAVPPDAPNPFLSSPVAVAFAAPAPAPAAAPRRSSTLPVPPLSAPAEPDPHVLHAWRDWSADLRVREQALRDREAQLTRREDALHQREIVAAVHAKGLQRLGMDVSAAATAATSRVVATPAEMSPAAPTPLRLARVPSSRGDAAARRDSASSAPMPARPRLYPDAVVPAAAAARRARTSPLPAGRATSPTPITTATPGATASESEALISTLLAEIDTLTQSLSVAQGEIAQREADYERLERRHADALGSYEGERARWAELDGQRDAVEDELKARIVVLEQMLGFERREERRGSGEHSHEPTRRPSADTGPSGDTGPHETTGYHLEPAAQEQRTVGNWVLDVREYAGAKGKGKLREGSASTDDAAVAAVVRRDSFGVGDDEAGPSGGGEHRGAAARGAAEREWEREEAEREAALKRARTGQQPQQRRQSQLLHRSSTPVSDLLLSPQLVSPHDVQVEWVGVDEPKGRGATGAVARLAL